MKNVTLLHNPNAGHESHSKKELISLIESNGYKCRYLSTKKNGWKKFNAQSDLIVAAGGDGTVRKVVKQVLKRKQVIAPIAVLPLGTANNIRTALKISGSVEEIIASWKKAEPKKFDVGIIEGIRETYFFLEAFGVGIFPDLMNKLKKKEELEKHPHTKMQATLHALHKHIYKAKSHRYELEIDGKNYSGKYLMVVIMNTNAIGPNLQLAPTAKTDDGLLNVVLIAEHDRHQLATHILKKTKNKHERFHFRSVKAKKVIISWEGTHAHADDQRISTTHPEKIKIKVKKKLLKFLV
jgi:diacylglycerol kinase (ATP)